MKKAIVVCLALILILLSAISCGVPQEDYAKVISDLTAAQTQIQSLQGELSTKETELSTKESELAAAQTQTQSLQGDLAAKETELSAKESELEVTNEKLEQGKARIEILNAIFIPAMTGELDAMTETEATNYSLEWQDSLNAVGDPVLTAKFEAFMDAGSDEALFSFFVYLLESTADALR